MINWAKYFDKIVCINQKEHKTRKSLMKVELKRVGILKYSNFEWEIIHNNSLEQQYDILLKNNKNEVKNISLIIGYINVIKKAYYQGCNNILILDDRNRFLKDLNKIEEILQNLPIEQDIIIFNKYVDHRMLYDKTIKEQKNKKSSLFYQFFDLKTSNCFSLNRKAMKQIISLFEINDYTSLKQKIENNLYVSIWNRVFSLTNLTVDVIFLDKENTLTEGQKQSSVIKQQYVYKNQEIDFNNYMMRKDGIPYFYGSYIEE